MSSELMSLTWVTALTAIMWMPYILNLIAVRGLLAGLSLGVSVFGDPLHFVPDLLGKQPTQGLCVG